MSQNKITANLTDDFLILKVPKSLILTEFKNRAPKQQLFDEDALFKYVVKNFLKHKSWNDIFLWTGEELIEELFSQFLGDMIYYKRNEVEDKI
jgi:hypothetical protein